MEHSTPKWIPATCVKRLRAEIFSVAPAQQRLLHAAAGREARCVSCAAWWRISRSATACAIPATTTSKRARFCGLLFVVLGLNLLLLLEYWLAWLPLRQPQRGAVAARQGWSAVERLEGSHRLPVALRAGAAVGSRLRKKSYPVSLLPHISREHLGLGFCHHRPQP